MTCPCVCVCVCFCRNGFASACQRGFPPSSLSSLCSLSRLTMGQASGQGFFIQSHNYIISLITNKNSSTAFNIINNSFHPKIILQSSLSGGQFLICYIVHTTIQTIDFHLITQVRKTILIVYGKAGNVNPPIVCIPPIYNVTVCSRLCCGLT